MLFGTSMYGQVTKNDSRPMPIRAPDNEQAISNRVIVPPFDQTFTVFPSGKATNMDNAVSVIPIGTSGNALGFSVGSRTANISINNEFQTIVFTHRLQTPNIKLHRI